jgi:hypothetical protein
MCSPFQRLIAGTVETEETAIPRQRLGKHVPVARNTHATQELLNAAFSMRSVSYEICNM